MAKATKKTTKSTKSKNNKKSIPKQKRVYVIDANFFISLKHVKASRPLEKLKKAKEEIEIEFYISDLVYKELPFYQGSASQMFKSTVTVKTVSDATLDWVKEDLTGMGINRNRFAQDPDLSLIAVCKKFINRNTRVFLVSDDFKLGENLKTLGYQIEYQSLSAFLLFLSKNSKTTELKSYFKKIQTKTLKYNLEYMLERKETYNPINKLMFLIENSIQISNDGVNISGIEGNKPKISADSRFENVCIDDIEDKDKKTEKIQDICNRYILSKPVNELDEIILMIPLLDEIKRSRRYLLTAKEALKEDQTDKAIKTLQSARNNLMDALQKAASLLPKNQYEIFQKVACTELSNSEFIRAFLYIGLDKIDLAIESLNLTASFATMGRTKRSALAINYLKALIYMFNQKYNYAIRQFEFTKNLAVNYAASELLTLKCEIGESITLFLSGKESEALELIDQINGEIEGKQLENVVIVFEELGDYFYAISNPKIAITLYREAMECAVDSEESKWRVNLILDKMKLAYMNAMLEGNLNDDLPNIDVIIDRVHELQNVDTFNEIIGELAKFNVMMYSDLNYTKKDKTIDYFKLEDEMKETFDVVDILDGDKATVLIAFNKDIGLVGFRIKLSMELMGSPENYTIKLKKNAKIRLIKPSAKLKAKYLIRAIVLAKEDHVDIDRNIPVFFAQMKI